MFENIVKYLLNNYRAEIKPILIPSELTMGTGICNPSILVEEDKIHLILRHVEYTLYICENEQKYQSANQGPLSYYHREDKNELKTNNSNFIEIEKKYIKDGIFFSTQDYLGIPLYVSIKNNFLSFEHTHPYHSYTFGKDKYSIASNLKKEINEIIYKENS